jgi:hypothetical protein
MNTDLYVQSIGDINHEQESCGLQILSEQGLYQIYERDKTHVLLFEYLANP